MNQGAFHVVMGSGAGRAGEQVGADLYRHFSIEQVAHGRFLRLKAG
ncbi:MAG: hypothetical protein GY859_38205 [Desulfobacterales bacterium]|nr:hypothetical protein [Desulfobacterales bacterium]